MKTRINSIISIAVLPFALFSCNRVLPDFPEDFSSDLITIQASISGAATKVAAVDAEVGLDWNWEEKDQIAVLSGDNVSVFDIRSGFEPKVAQFIGKQIKGEKFSIIYPGSITSLEGMQAVSVTDQIQNGLNDKAHLKYYALLSDVANYSSFAFSPESGALKQSGVLKFALTLPAETVVVSRVALKAGSPVFHSGNADDALTDELSIAIADGTLGADKTVTAWMTTSWFDDTIPADTALSLEVTAGDFNWVTDITPSADKTIKSGYVNKITVTDASKWSTGGRYSDGDGSQENPWIIKTAKQLTYMRDDLVSKELRYFKLAADIDLEGIEWAPLNNVGNSEDETKAYDKFVYFDGCGHTISNLTITTPVAYPSFAGVLYGTVKDVVFNNANITAGENKAGVVAGYVGTTQDFAPSVISNVEVKNSVLTGSRHMGAFVGQVVTADATITDCHVKNSTVTGAEYAAGFAGYVMKGTFTRCSANATVSGTKHVGGFVGKTEVPLFTDCWYEGPQISVSATGSNQSGGFVGYAAKVSNVGATFNKCYVKDSKLEMGAAQRIGGFVGQADLGTTFTKCYVKDVTINAGQNSGGFVGVDYANTGDAVPEGGIYQCYVDGGTITAAAANVGGFAGYPEKAIIQNCYSSMDVDGATFAAIGGFIGICKTVVTVQYCYASGSVAGSGANRGAFVGNVDGAATTHINYCIGWNDTLDFAGTVKSGCDVSGNYVGKEGTLAAKAAELGWDPAIWDFSAKLK